MDFQWQSSTCLYVGLPSVILPPVSSVRGGLEVRGGKPDEGHHVLQGESKSSAETVSVATLVGMPLGLGQSFIGKGVARIDVPRLWVTTVFGT